MTGLRVVSNDCWLFLVDLDLGLADGGLGQPGNGLGLVGIGEPAGAEDLGGIRTILVPFGKAADLIEDADDFAA